MKLINPVYDWVYALTQRKQTTRLILHHSASSVANAEGIHAYHKSLGWAGIAYHYLVRKDGSVYAGRPIGMQGGHTLNWNYCSVGVCFEGNFETEHMTDAQLKAGQELIEMIRDKYPGIIAGQHKDFNATACPGANFPFTFLVNPVDEGDVEGISMEPSAWAKEAWEWASALGITDGSAPKGAITREQTVTMLHRFAKLKGLEGKA
jgi:hypothetical protein